MSLTKVPNAMLESPGAGGNVQSGALTPSTTEAASPTAVIDHVDAEAAVILGAVPAPLNSLAKIATAINNDPTFVVTIGSQISTVGNSAAVAQSTANSAVSGLTGKADAFAEVDLGTGATFTLTVASHADRQVTYRGTGAAITLSPTGATGGKQIWVTHGGPSGTVSFSGVTASANHRNSIGAGETFNAIFANGTFYSLTPSTTAGSSSLGVVTGAGTVGNTLTFTPQAGLVGTYQWYWQDTGGDIGGATGSTYVIQVSDGSHNVGCKFTLTRFESNAVAISTALPGQVTNFLFGTAGTSTLDYSFTAPASGGAPTSYIVEYRTPPGSGAYTIWGGHVGVTTSGTITGLSSGTTYEGRCTAHNASGNGTPSATNSKATTSTKITFTDNFNAALNARWTSSPAGWTTSGGAAIYNGASFGTMTADCTAGDNTIAVDLDRPVAFGYPTLILRYVDDLNYLYAIYDDGSLRWGVASYIAGVITNLTSDTLDRGGTGVNASRVQLAVVGNTVTFTSTGGLNPGSFNKTMTGISALDAATKVGLGQNTGKPEVLWDNFTLS